MNQLNALNQDNPDDRNLDPYNALEKVVRLDRKHTNFDYYDEQRNVLLKVLYPQPFFQTPPGQHLLKGFWRHTTNYYFKKIELNQLERLEYLQSIIQIQDQYQTNFTAEPLFWYTIDRLFETKSNSKYQKDHLELKNWLSTMYLIWQTLKDKNKHKRIKQQIREIRSCSQTVYSKTMKDKYDSKKLLEIQNQNIQRFIPQPMIQNDQVSLKIQEYQQQLKQISLQNKQIFGQMKYRIKKELDLQEVSCCLNEAQEQDHEQTDDLDEECTNLKKRKNKLAKVQTTFWIKEYLKYSINNLQKKQIAESISKITKVQKVKGKNTEYKFAVLFQSGMNLKQILFDQAEMHELNNLREYNLIKFYNTSLKTQYSFICQNYLGFRQVSQNRTKPCRLKEKNIFQLMKQTQNQKIDPKISKQFANFDICHHCKLLYPEQFMTKCQYTSTKMGSPITPSSYYDPYISQIIKYQQPRLSNRYLGKRRNCYISYKKTNQQYTCDRKFCKYCLRQNYQEGLDKNGLCPFCQGICFCTRCARHDMIIRLKSIYLLLGGDINLLEKQSYIEKISSSQAQTMNNRTKSRSKNKSSKKSNNGPPLRLNQKMRNIRFQLEDLRILCDLVKRRQKQKQKLVQLKTEQFQRKIQMLNKAYNFKNMNGNNCSLSTNEVFIKDQQQEKVQKLKKKLKRMID